MSKTAPRIITQHEYISVDFGNSRRLTTSFSGQKASGEIPPHVWKAWLKAMMDKAETPFGERVAKFVADIDTLWPEWNVPPKTFEIGQEVSFDFGPRRGGVKKGKIEEKKRTTYTVRFEGMGLIGMAGDLLARGN